MNEPTPPKEFQSWPDYSIATMDARGAHLHRMFDGEETPSQDEIRTAVREEFEHLKKKVSMQWISLLENWQTALSNRLGRSANDILDGNLFQADFPDAAVHIRFKDGSDLRFRRAFYVGETPTDGAIHRVAVFTEHCGYHEFWLGPGHRIEDASPLNQYNPNLEYAKETNEWDNMAPVGGGVW